MSPKAPEGKADTSAVKREGRGLNRLSAKPPTHGNGPCDRQRPAPARSVEFPAPAGGSQGLRDSRAGHGLRHAAVEADRPGPGGNGPAETRRISSLPADPPVEPLHAFDDRLRARR